VLQAADPNESATWSGFFMAWMKMVDHGGAAAFGARRHVGK